MESAEDRAAAEELTREARAAPAMVRLGKLVAFVGSGRSATQAGNLKAPDAVVLASLLREGAEKSAAVSSMDDLPDVAHDFAGRSRPSCLPRMAPRWWPDPGLASWSVTP
jgi:hypothetical protein